MLIMEQLLVEKKKLLEGVYNLTREIGMIVEGSNEQMDLQAGAQQLEARGKLMEKINAIDKRSKMMQAGSSLQDTCAIQKLTKAIKSLTIETEQEDLRNRARLCCNMEALSIKIRAVNQGMKGFGAYARNPYSQEQSTEFDVQK